ncbi:MAG: ATP phosphoribosyltransferase [candidate division WS1 bacterium]|nr:ATP phosphoribosyltransferase [candidate division WS1 bacterium]
MAEDRQLRIGLPKGSLQNSTIELLRKAGFSVTVDERAYSPDMGDDELWAVLLRAQELPLYIDHGVLDCGLTGYDWILERNVDLVEVCNLIYAKGGMRPYRWVLAVHESSDINSIEDLQGKRIATELVSVTERLLAEHGVEAEVEFSWGATEAKCPDLVDAVVEGTETGSTLYANNLRIVQVLFESCTKLVANKEAWADPWKRAKIESIALLLNAALEAENKVGLKMNARAEDLDAVIGCLPALKKPTISPLANGGDDKWVAVETIVDQKIVKDLIPALKAAGAQGIIEYPLTKVVL